MASDSIGSAIGLYMNHQFVRFISLDFLTNAKILLIVYKETNYDTDNIDNYK